MKKRRMLEVGILNFSPSLLHTPNAYFSKNSCIIPNCFAKIMHIKIDMYLFITSEGNFSFNLQHFNFRLKLIIVCTN